MVIIMAKFILGNELTIEDYTAEMEYWCLSNLVYNNPEYIKKERMGLWLGKTPKQIYMYKRYFDKLVLPFGMCQPFYRLFKQDITEVKTLIKPIRAVDYHSSIKLYDYQEKAVQSVIKAKNGILVSCCGSGKTQMGLEIIARLGCKALWLTHTSDLQQQSYARAKNCFDCPDDYFGFISAGKVNIGKGITFALVQTMVNLDLAQYKDEWDCIIVDESAHVCGSPTKLMQFYKVLSNLSARYRVGLTATPYRADGLEKSMYAILGETAYEVSRSAVADKVCPVKVELHYTGYEPDIDLICDSDGTIIYSSLITDLCESAERTDYIVDKIANLDGSVLVLSDRIAHLTAMYNKLPYELRQVSAIIDGSMQSKKAKEKRRQVLEDLNNDKLKIVFASYKLAKEGLDAPNLKYVALTTPQKDKATIEQACGRVGRKADGKEYGTVLDFTDDFGTCYGAQKKRKSIYKKLGYTMHEMGR